MSSIATFDRRPLAMSGNVPELIVPMYIRYHGPLLGFGVHAAATLTPPEPRETNNDYPGPACAGTYGGFVGAEHEMLSRASVYAINDPRALPSEDINGIEV